MERLAETTRYGRRMAVNDGELKIKDIDIDKSEMVVK